MAIISASLLAEVTHKPLCLRFVIDSVDDFDTLANQYPHKYPSPRNPTVRPDWGRLASLVGAVHVTASAVTDEDKP